MAALTRAQIKDFVRVALGQLDSYKLTDSTMNTIVNFGIRRVQQDLMGVGIKFFTKQTTFSGNTVALPTDVMNLNNAFINIKAGTQQILQIDLATGNSGANHTISFTPLYGWAWIINVQDGGTVSVSITEGTADYTNNMIIYADFGVTTGAALVSALNASEVFRRHFGQAICSGTTSTVVDTAIVDHAVGATTGIPHTAVELTPEDFAKVADNTYLSPSGTQPYFKRSTGLRGNQVLEFLPLSITHGIIHYYPLLPDLTSDSSTSGLPPEFEEMLIQGVTIKSLDIIKNMPDSVANTDSYALRIQNIQADYDALLARHKQNTIELKTQNTRV